MAGETGQRFGLPNFTNEDLSIRRTRGKDCICFPINIQDRICARTKPKLVGAKNQNLKEPQQSLSIVIGYDNTLMIKG